MEKMIIVGNVGKAQVRESSSGKKYLSFSVFVNKKNKDNSLYDVQTSNGLVNHLNLFVPGKQVLISGDFEPRSKGDGSLAVGTIFADDVKFLNILGGVNSDSSTASQEASAASNNAPTNESSKPEELKEAPPPKSSGKKLIEQEINDFPV